MRRCRSARTFGATTRDATARWWTNVEHGDVYIGTSLRSLASQRDHQRGIVGFAARLSAEVAADPEEYELFDLLPTHRSQISYYAEGARQLLLPDVSFQLVHLGDFEWCLFEYERRATTPRRLPTRLRRYERYLRSPYAADDHGGLPPVVLSCSSRSAPRRSSSLPLSGCPGRRSPAPRRRYSMSTGCSVRPGVCPLRMHHNAGFWSTCVN